MRAVTVIPGKPNSLRLVEDFPEPPPDDTTLLVETLAIGVCGTDREIIDGEHGEPPPGSTSLVLGHESLGRVVEDPTGTFRPGDLVVGIVREPDPVPCLNCAVGEWDMCRNGRYTEHGIKGLHGFARDRWRIAPDFAIPLPPSMERVGMLLEPTSVVAKAWDHIERIGQRTQWQPRSVLVTGAGPVGLLAALLGAQRGLDVHVLDQATDGPKPALVNQLGANYLTRPVAELDFEPDIILECTGAPPVVLDVMCMASPNGIICLAGVPGGSPNRSINPGALSRELVLENSAVFGSVNANRRHWLAAAVALSAADPDWLAALITRRVPIEEYADAYVSPGMDIKVVLEFPR